MPQEQCYLRLIRALAAEQPEEWLDGPACHDLQPRRDQLAPTLQLAAQN